MTEEKKELSVEEAVAKAFTMFEERQAKKAAEEVALEQVAKAQKYDELMAKEEKEETWAESKKSVSIKKETKTGFADEDIVMFDKYLRGEVGLNIARKALQLSEVNVDESSMEGRRAKALTEGSATAGGVLVPSDWNAGLIELRDQASFPRKMGVQQITTSYDNIDIPAEATAFTKFVRTAEAGSYDTNDPVFAANNVTPQKWTKLTRLSEELVADEVYDLLGYLQRGYARAMAATENYYCAIGSGTNQHLGIMEGGDTDALTFDSSGNITADEIWELFYTLGAGYRENAAWLMASGTWSYIMRMRDSNNWAFQAADATQIGRGNGQPDGVLCNKPVFLQDDCPAYTTGLCPIMVGDPYYYALVDRAGLSIARLDELYKASGQVGFAANFRQSGTVLYELAFVGGAMA